MKPSGFMYMLCAYKPLREGFKKKKKKMVGFIQRSSDPSQPGRALD